MKIKKTKEFIPAREVEKIKYIAEDGEEFSNEDACRNYEERCNLLKKPIFKNSIKGFNTLDEGQSMVLYRITDNEDFEFIKPYIFNQKYERLYTDYGVHGSGWYMCWNKDGGDYSKDTCYLLNLDAYVKEKFKTIKTYTEEIYEAINHVENSEYSGSCQEN